MSISLQFLARLSKIRDGVAQLRQLGREVELGKVKLPELATTERGARARLEAFLPSQLLAFGPEVQDAATDLRRTEIVGQVMKAAVAALEAREVELRGALRRDTSEFAQELRSILRLCYPEPARGDGVSTNHGIVSRDLASVFERIAAAGSEPLEVHAEALVSLAQEFGARLPAASCP